jgi:hypothetical protein
MTDDDCVECIKCQRCCGACDCTGGPQIEQECTCYELPHMPGCYFNRPTAPAPPSAAEEHVEAYREWLTTQPEAYHDQGECEICDKLRTSRALVLSQTDLAPEPVCQGLSLCRS